MTKPPPKSRWKRVRQWLLWTAFGVSLPFLWILSVLFGDPAPIRISRETTYITEPVHPSGYVDLTDEVNRLLAEGAPDERVLDPEPLQTAIAAIQPTGRGSWNARWKSAHDRHRDAVADAVQMSIGNTRFPSLPTDGRATWTGLRYRDDGVVEQLNQRVNSAARLILQRLRDRIESLDRTGIIAEVSCLVDIQRFYARQRSMIYMSFCAGYQTQTVELLAKSVSTKLLTLEQCERVLSQFPEVSLDDVERLVQLQRLHALDQIFTYHSGEICILWDFLFTVSGANFQQRTYVDVGSRWVRGRVDWESVATRVNTVFDKIDRRLLSSADGPRNQSLDEIVGLSDWRQARFRLLRSCVTMSAQETTEWLTAYVLQCNTYSAQRVNHLTLGTHYINLLRLAISVEEHRRQHGVLPESLIEIDDCDEQVATLRPGFAPVCRYRRATTGFELLNVRDDSVLLRWYTGGEIVIPGLTDMSK